MQDLATKLADAALTIFVQSCRREVEAASRADLERACAAMRAQARPALAKLLDDAHAAPWIAKAAFQTAALEIAQAGRVALKAAQGEAA